MCSISSTGVPAPQVGGLFVRAFEMPRIGEQLVREDRGEMLERHGRREADDRRPAPRDRQPLLDLRLELAEVVARFAARLLNASCSRLWIASCVVKALISSASLGGAPSRNARTLSTKKASPLGKVVESAL